MENNRVKFWVGDFIDNESTPVETRNGDEVKIVNVTKSTGFVCGNIYNSSYRELQMWNEDGVHLKIRGLIYSSHQQQKI